MIIIVKPEDENGKVFKGDKTILPIQITVDKPAKAGFFARYGWLLFLVAVLIILGFIILGWLKRKRTAALNSGIYFSYAWHNEGETIVDKLYNSLKKAGFNVIRDKVNLKYKGSISGFMKDIGKSNIVIVVLSDKYLKSKFCMFELFEIYRNCGMNKEAFTKKVFPVREEEINLSDEVTVDRYVDFWKKEEQEWELMIQDKSKKVTSEQFAQYDIIRRISNELANLLYALSDINALNMELLAKNDFEKIKISLRTAVDTLQK